MTTIGAKYRNKITGVVGTATDHGEDPEGAVLGDRKFSVALTQLRLEPEHLDHTHVSQGHNLRWHPDADLEPVANED